MLNGLAYKMPQKQHDPGRFTILCSVGVSSKECTSRLGGKYQPYVSFHVHKIGNWSPNSNKPASKGGISLPHHEQWLI
ncbi:hypothetical protein HanRHA438_Chr05g0228381 [Helianthus annuus]|nr:hypothetical protein HanRHA438_Chr05g0228381 [Helianthus annuus]